MHLAHFISACVSENEKMLFEYHFLIAFNSKLPQCLASCCYIRAMSRNILISLKALLYEIHMKCSPLQPASTCLVSIAICICANYPK